ncbi:MAG: guanylate kinase [Leptospiraceae bacterium]|nr:guanylate kinase [Leptospiraceae bacterium]MCP5497413.1 guanylate kinase [Leptospiraceae bacterium]
MNQVGQLFIISSVAGGGKSTLIQKLLNKDKDLKFSVSFTSRSIRHGEVQGESYHFVDSDTFQKLIEEEFFFEWAKVHNNYYGTPKKYIYQWLNDGKKVILDIDIQGAKIVKKNIQDAISIFILPPSEEIWFQRLRGRGTETEESLNTRFANGKIELKYANDFDYQILNDNLEEAFEKLTQIIYRD